MRAAVFLLVAACSAYDPDLGGTPFLCGTSDPRCPDGYVAVDVSTIRCECQRPGAADAGGGYACYTDPDEPNETFRDPTPLDVMPPLPVIVENVSVCPGTDRDVYSVQIARVGSTLAVEVDFDVARQAPSLDIEDMSGGSLDPTVLQPASGKVTASILTTYSGVHYVALAAGPMGEAVNYTLRVQVTEP